MLGDTIKTLRTKRGLTQEELAIRLHVVRQTVSKWEKGLSTPDAEMLRQLADELEVSVQELLGGEIREEASQDEIAQQLARLNEHLAVRNRRTSNIIKALCIGMAALLLLMVGLTAAGITLFSFRPGNVVVTGETEVSFDITDAKLEKIPEGNLFCTLQASGVNSEREYEFILTTGGNQTSIPATVESGKLTAALPALYDNVSYGLSLQVTRDNGIDQYPLYADLMQFEEGSYSWVECWND